ncbi:MAG: DEAD/DEAH box helicase [Candidatus Micrarchaeota archaeon]|nr:DEAD/DEAH box helicase [Candidatus Micrarchaeota archaeon]
MANVFSETISRGLAELKFEQLTEIQELSIPIIMKGDDIIAQARTGTGKTAAFAIPILEKAWHRPDVQALVMVPTRELAIQVGNDFRRIGKYSHARVLVAYGGSSLEKQIELLEKGVQIVVGTPGRLLDLIERRALDLSRIQFLVLDEADVMLDMGFSRDVERIISFTPGKKQVMLFCVDLPEGIMRLAKRHLRYPQHVKLISEDKSALSVAQYHYQPRPGQKLAALLYLLEEKKPTKALIFCRTKHGVKKLARLLNQNGVPAEGIQGDLSQAQRDRAMQGFKSGETPILVATDIAARGIHVERLSHVFNYELPHDINYYIHRIGRTGRMYSVGEAITLCYPPEFETLKRIERLIGKKLEDRELPESLPQPRVQEASERPERFGGRPWQGRRGIGGGFGGRRPWGGGGGRGSSRGRRGPRYR